MGAWTRVVVVKIRRVPGRPSRDVQGMKQNWVTDLEDEEEGAKADPSFLSCTTG